VLGVVGGTGEWLCWVGGWLGRGIIFIHFEISVMSEITVSVQLWIVLTPNLLSKFSSTENTNVQWNN